MEYVSDIIFLLDRASLKLLFLPSAFFVRFTHSSVGSSIHCVLYCIFFFHTVVVRPLDLFHIFPSYKQFYSSGQEFPRVLIGVGVCTFSSYQIHKIV